MVRYRRTSVFSPPVSKMSFRARSITVSIPINAITFSPSSQFSSSKYRDFDFSTNFFEHCGDPNQMPLLLTFHWWYMQQENYRSDFIFSFIIVLKTCGHSDTICNNSLRNTSSSSCFLGFPTSSDPCDGVPRLSLIISLFSMLDS